MKKMITFLLAILMVATLLTACGNTTPKTDLEAIKASGKLIVGITD